MKAILKICYNFLSEEEEMVTEIIEYNTDEEIRAYCGKCEKEFNDVGYDCHFSWTRFDDRNIIDIRGILKRGVK